MTRTKKNILMIIIAVLLAGCMVFTAHSAGASLGPSGGPPQMTQDGGGGQPPTPPDGNIDSNNGSNGKDSSASDRGQQPQMPGSSDSSNSDNDNGNSNNGQPPTPPDGEFNGNGGPDGSKGDFKDGSKGDFKDGPGQEASMSDIGPGWYILFGAEGLAFALVLMYLIMSGMNRKTFRETFGADVSSDAPTETISVNSAGELSDYYYEDDRMAEAIPAEELSTETEHRTGTSLLNRKRIAAFCIAAVLIAGALVPAQGALAATAFAGGDHPKMEAMQDNNGSGGQTEQSAQATGATTVDGTNEALNDSYSSTEADENAILVTNGGVLTSDGAAIDKKSGDSSNTGSSDFSGVNSALLVQENSSAEVKNAAITTSAKGANAVFATGENARIKISDSTISTTGEASSRGLDATYGGTIEADNVTITTQGGSCAAMATDRGEGTVSAKNSKLETNGAGSPIIYSTGEITLTDSTGTANGAQIAVVEGKNSATIENSAVTCSATGNRGDVDVSGVMIYQSMSGDASEGTGNFTAKESALSIDKDSSYYKTAPMFFVTNTDAVIDLTDTDLNFGSGVLLSAQGTSEWGQEGSNGGNVTLNASSQKLVGDVQLDEISSLEMNLTGSSYKGTINGDQEAKSVTLTLDKNSKITLTGDSYVDSLEDADTSYSNIDFNGYKLYVDGEAIN